MGYPRLNPLFFDHFRPTTEWCSGVLTSSSKTFHSKLVPLYEWEGILFVGIPKDQDLKGSALEIEGHWQLVLADSQKLAEFWATYFENISKKATQNLSHLNLKQVAPENLFDALTNPTNAQNGGSTSVPNVDLPEGLNFSSNVGLNTQQTDKIIDYHQTKFPRDNGGVVEAPELLDLPELPELPNISAPRIESTVTTGLEDNLDDKTILIDTKFDNPAVPSSEVVLQNSSSRPKRNGFIRDFNALPKPYKRAIQLEIHDNSLRVLNAEGNPTATSVDLLSPSPFRIVYRTRNDYHGRVVPCVTLEKFFAEVTRSAVPPFITIVPIINNSLIEGMIIAWSESDIQPLHYLASLKASLNIPVKRSSAA